jgi:dihydroflavonol-4-reductase
MENVLWVLREVGSPTPRLVYVSSATTVAPSPEGAPSTEERRYERPPSPTPYFAAKEAMERMALRAASEEGLPVVVVNPSLVVDAPDPKPTSGQLLLAVARRWLPFLLRGRVNVVAGRDVGEGIALAARHGRAGERYILGGENMPLEDFLRLVARLAGVSAPRWFLPLWMAEVLAWKTEVLALLTPWRPPLFPLHALHMLRHGTYLDSTKAATELGWRSGSVEAAVRRALDWFREEGRL